MAEIKNTFIKAKMNKDLDDRLVPPGEYRNAQNVSISRSEGSDVGALENILGNSVISSTVLNIPNLDVIGFLADNATNNIYLFLTDYIDPLINSKQSFAPSNANCFIYAYNTLGSGSYNKLVEGSFLNFAKNFPITGVNLLEDLLFWTDNRNQPRKINIGRSLGYYTSEDTISVAKPAPYEAIRLLNVLESNELLFESTMQNPSQEFLPDGSKNYYWNENWQGDPNFLKDKFVRFSYRYKFDDGEYSIMAPFTQPCFIPKQNGYFLDGDQEEAYRSTVVQFLENNVTQIGLNILFDTINPYGDLHITDVEILYKESDGLAIKLVQSIPIDKIQGAMVYNMSTDPIPVPIPPFVYQFLYTSTKPYRTLPSDQTTRVYDMVPVKALAQEVSGNRVMYGNFYDKMSPPSSLDYGVGYSIKSKTNQVEYPNHTVKQNRNYQVGVILSDKFGRQSSVLLSSLDERPSEDAGVQYKGSTIYIPYYSENESISILDFSGYALKIRFNDTIPTLEDIDSADLDGYPGLYSETNPLGWYSYKIVVRQQEQDYYNVYLPSILNGYPDSSQNTPTNENNKVANIVLINDNINKIPRDLSEVGPDQRQYRSSVQIYGRVENTAALNKQYYPGSNSDTVVSISTISDTNYNNSKGTNLVYPEFYQSETNPLIGRINTQQAIGTLGSATYDITLGVYETTPTISLLDIYWETSSTGLISELNTAISEGTPGPFELNLGLNGYIQNEGMAIGTDVVTKGYTVDSLGDPIDPASYKLFVQDATGNNRSNDFEIYKPNSTYEFSIKTKSLFYFGSNTSLDAAKRSFTFSVECTDVDNAITKTLNFQGSLTNIKPIITNCPTSQLNLGELTDPWIIRTMTGKNGMADGGNQTAGLVWSITSVKYNGILIPEQTLFQINSVTGVLSNPQGTAEKDGSYEITVGLQDAAGLEANPCVILASFGTPISITLQTLIKGPIGALWQTTWNTIELDVTQITESDITGNLTTSTPNTYASSSLPVTITPLPPTFDLPTITIYLFKKNGSNEEVITRTPEQSGVVNYTFNVPVEENDVFTVDVSYGCTSYIVENTSGQGVITYSFTDCTDGQYKTNTLGPNGFIPICSYTFPSSSDPNANIEVAPEQGLC